MYKNTLRGLAFGLALIAGTTAVAYSAAPGGWRGHHDHGQMMVFGKLNLSDAQRAQIKQIFQNTRNQNQTSRQSLRQQREAFEAMTPNTVGYQDAAAKLGQAEGAATQTRVEQMASVRAQVYAVLTPSQRAQLSTYKSQAQARRQQWQQFKAEHPLPAGQ